MHLGLITWLSTEHRTDLRSFESSDLYLRLTKLSNLESIEQSSTYIANSRVLLNKDSSTIAVPPAEAHLAGADNFLSNRDSPGEQTPADDSKPPAQDFDPAQFSFGNMPAMPLGATSKGGWGVGAFTEATERLPPEAQATQQLQMRISKQKKLVLGFLDQAQEELASRLPPTFCVVKLDTSWLKSSVKCESAQDELLVNQFLMRGNVTHATTALPIASPCTHIGGKKPQPEFECP